MADGTLAVLDGGGAAQYLKVNDTGLPAPDPGVNILIPIHQDPVLADALGSVAAPVYGGAGNATLIGVSKGQYALLELVASILTGTLSVTGPITSGQMAALNLATAANQAAANATLSTIATNTGNPIATGGNVIGKVDVRANGADVSNAAPLPVTSQGFDVNANFTRPANTTAYAAGDVVGPATGAGGGILTFAGLGQAGKPLLITSAELMILLAAIPGGMTTFNLHLYSATPPSALADNDPWAITNAGDQDAYLGSITFTPADIGAVLYNAVDGINRQRLLASANVYGYLVTVGGFTPTSGEVYRPRLHGMGL